MAIALECINFIVPIEVIRKKYPGGWEQCLWDHEGLIGGRVWFDEHLFRDGAMNPLDIHFLTTRWTELGFQPMGRRGRRKVWEDFCVVGALSGKLDPPCDWLEFSEKGFSAWLKGTAPGELVPKR